LRDICLHGPGIGVNAGTISGVYGDLANETIDVCLHSSAAGSADCIALDIEIDDPTCNSKILVRCDREIRLLCPLGTCLGWVRANELT